MRRLSSLMNRVCFVRGEDSSVLIPRVLNKASTSRGYSVNRVCVNSAVGCFEIAVELSLI